MKIGSCFRGDLQAKCWDSSISGLPLGLEMALGTVTFERMWSLGLSLSVGLETYKVFQETYGLRPRPPVLLSKQTEAGNTAPTPGSFKLTCPGPQCVF